MSERGSLLELRGLDVGHGRRALVRDVCLAVQPGQVVALIGPNGSGKTTILRTVAGQLRALGGVVELYGRALGDVPAAERARTMSVMLTGRPQTELLTCRDVVEAGRYPFTGRLGVLGEKDHDVVTAAMEATGVLNLAERDFAHVSDGQRQRVLLARALCQEPRVLLLDEPTSYLDVRSQLEVLQLLRREARERGIAVVASLHEVDLAQKAADHVICIKDGHVMCQGSPDEVFTAERIADLYDLAPGAYDPAFGSVELGEHIRELSRTEEIEEITLIGLCTDICVISNALLLKAYLPESNMRVISSCCAGVTPGSHDQALEAMKMCQIEIL